MDVLEAGHRGFVFSFSEPFLTNVYVVLGENISCFCDTFLGPEPMEDLSEWFNHKGHSLKTTIAFYSHYHYDHVWGTCALDNPVVVSQVTCRELLMNHGQADMQKYAKSMMGNAKLILPNVTFLDRLDMHDEDVTLWHTPGHTPDCSSLYDSRDEILFVGDNVESPVPFLDTPDTDVYVRTLQSYLDLNWNLLVPSHDPPMNDDRLLRSNIRYLQNFDSGDCDSSLEDRAALMRHTRNLVTVARCEQTANKHEIAAEYLVRARNILANLPETESVIKRLRTIEEMLDTQL